MTDRLTTGKCDKTNLHCAQVSNKKIILRIKIQNGPQALISDLEPLYDTVEGQTDNINSTSPRAVTFSTI